MLNKLRRTNKMNNMTTKSKLDEVTNKYLDAGLIKQLRSRKQIVFENKRYAKQLVDQGKLSPEDFNNILNIDKTATKKYVGWMAKQWILNNGGISIDDLRNTVEEYASFADRNKAKHKDINQYTTFADLQKDVHELNQSGQDVSVKDLENDYEVIVDNSNLLIMSPHTHEASRKLGLSHFAYRSCDDGSKDSAWCTTYKVPNHFNDYYYKNTVTFYYIKVKSPELQQKIMTAFNNGKEMLIVALAVLSDGQFDGYTSLNNQIPASDIKKYNSIIGIS